jgi:putative Holliday junction resolvase
MAPAPGEGAGVSASGRPPLEFGAANAATDRPGGTGFSHSEFFMARVLGIDYGLRRIGIAISDGDERIVSPERVLEGRGSAGADADAVFRVAAELDAAEFVVGLPLNMDGTESDQTRLTRTFAAALQAKGGGPVHLWDERLTSHAAETLLAERNLTRKKRRARQDAVAAAIMLTGFLDARRARRQPLR